MKIKKVKHAEEWGPLDPECQCDTCRNYSRAYLHHLFRANEPTVGSMITAHNLHYMNDMTAELRRGILDGEI